MEARLSLEALEAMIAESRRAAEEQRIAAARSGEPGRRERPARSRTGAARPGRPQGRRR